MNSAELRAVAEDEKERVRVAAVISRADTAYRGYRAAQRIFDELPDAERKKVQNNWLEFYARSDWILDMCRLKVWGLKGRGHQSCEQLTLFTGRLKLLSVDSLNHKRVAIKYC